MWLLNQLNLNNLSVQKLDIINHEYLNRQTNSAVGIILFVILVLQWREVLTRFVLCTGIIDNLLRQRKPDIAQMSIIITSFIQTWQTFSTEHGRMVNFVFQFLRFYLCYICSYLL